MRGALGRAVEHGRRARQIRDDGLERWQVQIEDARQRGRCASGHRVVGQVQQGEGLRHTVEVCGPSALTPNPSPCARERGASLSGDTTLEAEEWGRLGLEVEQLES